MVCLISGGASGIGLAAARRIMRRMPVVIADLDAARVAAAVASLDGDGEAVGVVCDVRSTADCLAAVAATEQLGALSDVVSAAGIVDQGDGPLADCNPEAWDRILGVNLTGAANLVRAALPELQHGSGGDIVLVASNAALTGRPGVAAYSASKAGLIGLQHGLIADYAVHGVRCNCVCPGPTATPMTRSRGKLLFNATGEMAEADQVAAAIDWLVLDDSNWLIGGVLPLDGAETAAISQAFGRQ